LGVDSNLPAQVRLAERLAVEREAELQALQKENEQLKSERTHYCERVVLLEEELRWMKVQYFGTSSRKTDRRRRGQSGSGDDAQRGRGSSRIRDTS
jgi:hypothetical protein